MTYHLVINNVTNYNFFLEKFGRSVITLRDFDSVSIWVKMETVNVLLYDIIKTIVYHGMSVKSVKIIDIDETLSTDTVESIYKHAEHKFNIKVLHKKGDIMVMNSTPDIYLSIKDKYENSYEITVEDGKGIVSIHKFVG